MTPKRIQRKRTKGWTMPEDTIYVGRPTKWGNPFRYQNGFIYCNASHNRKILDPWILYYNEPYDKETGLNTIIRLYEDWIYGIAKDKVIPCPFTLEDIKLAFQGLDLACWCPENKPCHANVLLKIANR